MRILVLNFYLLLLTTNILSQSKSIHFKGELKLGFENITNNFLFLSKNEEINGDILVTYKIYDQENNLLWMQDAKIFITDLGKLLFSKRPHRNQISIDILNMSSHCKRIEKNKSFGWWTKNISRTVNVGVIEIIF